jgi:hypothetical protein
MKYTIFIISTFVLLAAGCSPNLIQDEGQSINRESNNTNTVTTTEWSTHTNKELGFEIKTPQDWTTLKENNFYQTKDEGQSYISNTAGETPSIQVIVTRTKSDIKDVWDYNESTDYTLPSGIVTRRKISDSGFMRAHFYLIERSPYVYNLTIYKSLGPDENYQPLDKEVVPGKSNDLVINAILSSFKFIN